MVVEIDELVNHISGLLEGSYLLPVDALRLEDGKEILRHGVIIAVPTS